MSLRRWWLPTMTIALLIGALHAWTFAAGIPQHLPVTSLEIRTTANDSHTFQVSVATKPEDRQRGLMYVKDMRPDQGMLFELGEPRVASMWMKNTPLPLDMVFIRDDGSISSIVRNTEPYSRTAIHSNEPIIAVLELLGGTCDRLGINVGDIVTGSDRPSPATTPKGD
jgi:uncharacterized membrane protein (UPF0127 family)